MLSPETLYLITAACVMACWIVFAPVFLLRKREKTRDEKKRDNRARLGILLEALAYAIIWMFRRKDPLLFENGGIAGGIALSLLAVVLAVLSVALMVAALKTLGKQWAVAARVVEGHQLITEGPYNLVRNPIYSGMFGMLIATGITFSMWYAIVIAIPVFWYGTMIRVHVEEKLLRETFGDQFDEYKRRVPSLIPKLL